MMHLSTSPTVPAPSNRDERLDQRLHLQRLNQRKRRFVLIAAGGILIFSLIQPILSVFTTLLDAPAFAGLSWGWVYAIAQFAVPLALLQTYRHYMIVWDKEAHQDREENHG